jgi:molybdopterin-synthase adenylyltransferase
MVENKYIKKQFIENFGVLNEKEFNTIKNAKIAIIGLGGLGGNVANELVRLGAENLNLIDYDRFEETNLNRQLFSNISNIGDYKVDIIKAELLKINPNCIIEVNKSRIQDLDIDILNKYDFIIDAVDNPQTKIFISELGTKLNIPVLHGACAGWYGQVGWILPGSKLIKGIYGNEKQGIEQELKNPSFTPSAVASIMVAEFLKYIKKSDKTVINQVLLIDLLNNTIIKTGDKQ